MATGKPIEELSSYTGYRFKDGGLLQVALTHSSFTNECRKTSVTPCNERMEFLGDAVLQIIVSDHLYTTFSSEAEGHLTKLRQSLVCESTLASLARRIHLGEFLVLGKGEEQNGGRDHDSILADAFEALLAAIYIDSEKDTTFLQMFLIGLLREELEKCTKTGLGDYKTRLQQLVQQAGHDRLYYEVVKESGPDHKKQFEVRAMLNSNEIGKGVGFSKREAEQAAARAALILFGEND